MFRDGEFVAVDGEGFSEGPEEVDWIGGESRPYRSRPHFYAYLAASDGAELWTPEPGSRLSLAECLAFLCERAASTPNAILVAFGASYDVIQMLAYDLSRRQLARLVGTAGEGGWLVVTPGDGFTYRLHYRPRKCFTVQRWREGELRWRLVEGRDGAARRKSTPHLTVRLWDVIGFFQEAFAEVMAKWLPGDPDEAMIRTMKAGRRTFERSEIDVIRRYNAAELRILVKIMQRLRDAIADLGLQVSRWDGAGAIAAAMMQKHAVKEATGDDLGRGEPGLFHAVRCAYSGGHIEACQVGRWSGLGPCHHYDINSAYPHEFIQLPRLDRGRWAHLAAAPGPANAAGGAGTGWRDAGFALVHLRWDFPPGKPFYPLFWRNRQGSILYPRAGSGWYWRAEALAAFAWFAALCDPAEGSIEAGEAWVWEPDVCLEVKKQTSMPFAWVRGYYARRIEAGPSSGIGKVIKTGLAALYGKTAQQLGAKLDDDGEVRAPPYFQLAWAGAVTAGVRASMIEAAILAPWSVIGFATDGLFTTEALPLDCPAEKVLGAWEYQRHAGIVMVMPGVYWLLEDDRPPKGYSRGFDKEKPADLDLVIEGWRRGDCAAIVELERLVGLATATSSRELWRLRGRFVTCERDLALDGDNSKRYPLRGAKERRRCARELVRLTPRDHDISNLFGWEPEESWPYPIAWLDGDDGFGEEIAADRLEELEAWDAELA